MVKLSFKEIADLFDKAKNGDDEAFKNLYMSTSRAQYFIAYNYLENDALAQEAIQNMYVAFFNNMHKIERMAVVEWMNTTTINECNRLIRQEKLDRKVDIDEYEDKIVDTESDTEALYNLKDDNELLNKSLNKLEPDIKKIIIYRYVNNLTVKEISKQVGLSTATINRYIKTGIMELKKYFEKTKGRVQMVFFGISGSYKLFDEVMSAQLNSVTEESILKNIVGNTSLEISSTSVVGASIFVKSRNKKIAKSATKVTCGAGVVATIVIVITPAYSINIIDDDYVLKQRIQVVSKINNKINNFEVYKNNSLIAIGDKNNNYIVDIKENGVYQLNVTDANGKVHKEEINIANIDYEPPTIDIKNSGNHFEVLINENGCGINYDSIEVTDGNNNKIPFLVDNNLVTFVTNIKQIAFRVSDNLNNTRETTIYINK